jgi:hypothetical protein
MNKSLILACLLAGLASASLAVDGEIQDRRDDNATYRPAEPDQVEAGPAAVAGPRTPERAQTPSGPLVEMRQRHAAELEALVQAFDQARDESERQSLERQAASLKLAHSREELGLFREAALARGDEARVLDLEQALSDLEPRPATPANVFVPRDATTGRALNGSEEGGAR